MIKYKKFDAAYSYLCSLKEKNEINPIIQCLKFIDIANYLIKEANTDKLKKLVNHYFYTVMSKELESSRQICEYRDFSMFIFKYGMIKKEIIEKKPITLKKAEKINKHLSIANDTAIFKVLTRPSSEDYFLDLTHLLIENQYNNNEVLVFLKSYSFNTQTERFQKEIIDVLTHIYSDENKNDIELLSLKFIKISDKK